MHFINRVFYLILTKLTPKSLLTRFTLIICIPVIISQLISVFLFYDRHWNNVTFHTVNIISNEVKLIEDTFLAGDLTTLVKYSRYFNFKIEFINKKRPLSFKKPARKEIKALHTQLVKNLKYFKGIEYKANKTEIIIWLENNKHQLIVKIPPKPLLNPTVEIFVLWIVGISLILLIMALIFSKNQIRAIQELSKTADLFGRGYNKDIKFKPAGALEIRQAGRAFIKMSERIQRNILKRTQMLAMISHDLRTPLTRMLLQLALLPDTPENRSLNSDVESMKHMIDSYLDFARGEEGESFEKVELITWLKEFLNKNIYKDLEINFGDEINCRIVEIKPLAFKRALSNILTNAQKYARRAVIYITLSSSEINIIVEDDGPGINEEEKALVFKPFYRSDKARKIDDHGSVGLGLSICKEIILSHKGNIKIEDSKALGGLKVIITLPTKNNNT